MKSLDSKSLLLCMIAIQGDDITGEIGGITRLQKLIFLLEKEYGIQSKDDRFEFTAYKAGPYSSNLYDDLEFLENIGHLKSEIVGEAVQEEVTEIDALNFEDLISAESDLGVGFADNYLERSFKLTDQGREKVKELMQDQTYGTIFEGIRRIKSKYGNYSLQDILYYVYSKYPEMTTESQIKDKVLGIKKS